jgi:hypothetical protein
MPDVMRTDPETLAALREKARLDRDRADAARAHFELEQTRGKFVLRSEVEEQFRTLGLIVKGILLGWSSALPARLEGLTAAEISDTLQVETDKVLHVIAAAKIGAAPTGH